MSVSLYVAVFLFVSVSVSGHLSLQGKALSSSAPFGDTRRSPCFSGSRLRMSFRRTRGIKVELKRFFGGIILESRARREHLGLAAKRTPFVRSRKAARLCPPYVLRPCQCSVRRREARWQGGQIAGSLRNGRICGGLPLCQRRSGVQFGPVANVRAPNRRSLGPSLSRARLGPVRYLFGVQGGHLAFLGLRLGMSFRGTRRKKVERRDFSEA